MAEDAELEAQWKRPEVVEEIDDLPVLYYKAKIMAGSGTVLDPDWAQEWLTLGKLPIFLVAATVKDWTPRFDANGDLRKDVRLQVEELVPVQGAMRDQAKIYLHDPSKDLNIALPMSSERLTLSRAVGQMELLEQYLDQRWLHELGNEDETPVETVIRLMEELREINGSVPPQLELVRPTDEERTVIGDSVATPEPNSWEEAEAEVPPAVAEALAMLEDDEDELPAVAPLPTKDGGPIFDEPAASGSARGRGGPVLPPSSGGPIFDEPRSAAR